MGLTYTELNPYDEYKKLLSDLRTGTIEPTPVVLRSLYADLYSCATSLSYSQDMLYSFEDLQERALDKKSNGNFEGLEHDRVIAQYALNTDITADELKSILSIGTHCQECLEKFSTQEIEQRYLDPIAAQFTVSQKEHQAYIAMVPPEKKFLDAIKDIGHCYPVLHLQAYGEHYAIYGNEFFEGSGSEQLIDIRIAELKSIGIDAKKDTTNSEAYEYVEWKIFPIEAQKTLAVHSAAAEIASKGEIIRHGDREFSDNKYKFTVNKDNQAWIETKDGETVFSPRGGFLGSASPEVVAELLRLPQEIQQVKFSNTESIETHANTQSLDSKESRLGKQLYSELGGNVAELESDSIDVDSKKVFENPVKLENIEKAGIYLASQYGERQADGSTLFEATFNDYSLKNDDLTIINKEGKTIFKDRNLTQAASPHEVKQLLEMSSHLGFISTTQTQSQEQTQARAPTPRR